MRYARDVCRASARPPGRAVEAARAALAAGLAILLSAALLAAPAAPTAPTAPPAAAAKSICILFSRDLPPYREAVEGFKSRLGAKEGYVYVERVVTETDVGRMMAAIKKTSPALILALGTEAGKVAAVQSEDTPVLFAMVANPVDSGILPRRPYPTQTVAGVTTDVSARDQFEALRRAMPDASRIAVIYCPQYTEATVTAAETQAKAMGIELVRLPVEPFRVDPAIEQLEKARVDALWTVTDPGVMVPATARRILTATLKAKIPVIGFSPAMVRAGALLGLGIEARTVGEQAGDVALAILRGGKTPADFNLVYPDKTTIYVNLGVASRIGVKFPDDMVAASKTVQGE
jgi:putative ABC transport system substrate-binding protein